MIKSKYFQLSENIFIENSFTRWYYFHSNIYLLPMKHKYLGKPSIDLTYDIVTSGQVKLISKINFAIVSAFRFNESITYNKNLHYKKTFPSKLKRDFRRDVKHTIYEHPIRRIVQLTWK